MRRPLLGVCLFFCLGISISNFIDIPFFIYLVPAALFLLSSFILLKKQRASSALLYIAIFFIGALIFKNSQILPPDHVNKYIHEKGEIVGLRGIIYSDPIIKQANYSKKTSFELIATAVKTENGWQEASGRILVNVFQDKVFSYANELLLEGKLYRVPNFYISKRLNYRQHLARRSIFGILSISNKDNVLIIGQSDINPIKRVAIKIKETIRNKIHYYLSGTEANILKAIILGERHSVSEDINNMFVQTGTAHILAISGLHVGIIVLILLISLKALRIPKRSRCLFTILVLVIYVFITGGRASVIRAAIMITVLLAGIFFERETDIYNSLSFAALAILVYNPNQLFDIGFQLSFISVISIFYFGDRIQRAFFKTARTNSKTSELVVRSFSVSLGIWLGVAGFIALYFNVVAPITIFANLFVVPLISIIIALSFSFVLTSFIIPFISAFIALTTEVFIAFLVRLIYTFSKVPGAYFYIEDFNLAVFFVYYLTIIGLFNIKRLLELTRLRKYDKLR